MQWWGRFLHEFLQTLGSEGLRLTRIRAIGAGIRVIQAFRYVFLFHYFALMLSFLCSLSLFFTIYLVATQLAEHHTLILTWPLGLCSGLLFSCTGLLFFALREKTWMNLFRIEELVDAAIGPGSSSSSSGDVSPEAIARIVEQVLERKFRELASQEIKPKS